MVRSMVLVELGVLLPTLIAFCSACRMTMFDKSFFHRVLSAVSAGKCANPYLYPQYRSQDILASQILMQSIS
ncbi:hypothetical protein M758_12G006900 [Ceratodon purpureus]|uniref:Secreted protein n=1 Tax=Ceratodon purpureus TaxID=3225 RepID=A0A8T0G287_CERPU|nr:hypothetical protein KC19_12G006300 [Ceratodon purpureus]KAG0597587.1 hypothetical protein M758_12G006900 [Ceratodon purpureus]